MTVRVVVADDHPIVRDGLRALLGSLPDVEMVGEATTGREAVRSAVTDRPDVIVMDLRMPDLDGTTATAEICRVAPDVAVLVLTMLDDDDSVFAAMRAGARGYLVKGASQQEIVRAITAVAAGEAIFGPGVARRVLRYFASPPAAAQPAFPELARVVGEDGRQPHVRDLRQAPGRRSRRSHHPGPGGRSRPLTPHWTCRLRSRSSSRSPSCGCARPGRGRTGRNP
jgi:DNA-binding NarL/FixJ family response regulator